MNSLISALGLGAIRKQLGIRILVVSEGGPPDDIRHQSVVLHHAEVHIVGQP